jgi:hypothetical protein
MRKIVSFVVLATSLRFIFAQESAPAPGDKAPTQPDGSAKLIISLTSEPMGKPGSKFYADTPNIYARWEGHGLRDQAKIRAVWIAENIGDVAPSNYTIDEATATAPAADARGVFVLSRPEGGWAPGDYRVEFSVDDELIETVKLKIAK